MRTSVGCDAGAPASGAICQKAVSGWTADQAASPSTSPSTVGAAVAREATAAGGSLGGAGAAPLSAAREGVARKAQGRASASRRLTRLAIVVLPFFVLGLVFVFLVG